MKLKVYCVSIVVGNHPIASRNGQVRAFAAVRSQKEFATLIRSSVNFVRVYASVTGNAEQVAMATAEPGVLFYESLDYPKKWSRA